MNCIIEGNLIWFKWLINSTPRALALASFYLPDWQSIMIQKLLEQNRYIESSLNLSWDRRKMLWCECDVNGLNRETNKNTQETQHSHTRIGSNAPSPCLFITQCMLMSPLVITGNIVNTHTVIHKHKMFQSKLLSPQPLSEPGRGKSPDTRDTRAATHKTRVPMCWHLTRVVQCSDRNQDEVPSAHCLLDASPCPVFSEYIVLSANSLHLIPPPSL